MTTTDYLAPNRRRRPLAFGRRPHAPNCTTTPTVGRPVVGPPVVGPPVVGPPVVGRLVVTRLGPDDAAASAKPASIGSVSVRSPAPAGASPVVLRYRHGLVPGAHPPQRAARGYWAVLAEAALGRAGLSARSQPRADAPVAASTTGS